MEQIFLQLHPELNLGDSGSIEEHYSNEIGSNSLHSSAHHQSTALAEIPEELMSEGRSTLNTNREQEQARPSITSTLTA